MRAWLAALAVLLVGCRETRAVRWELAFADPALRAESVVVVTEVRRGTCLEDREVVHREELGVGEIGAPVPTLGGGPHAFAAVARDAWCVVIARGCADVLLPTDPDRVVRTVLAGVTAGPPVCDACSAGRCAADAGP